MALSREVEKELQDIREKTEHLKASMRYWFDAKNPTNYITIQRVNNECALLKAQVQNITNRIIANDYCRARAVLESARFNIGKYEQALNQEIPLDGDIFLAVARGKQEIKQ